MPRLILTTTIPAPAQDCFVLSLSVDAHSASMRGSGERAVAGVTEGVMTLGDTVTWQARHLGVPVRMTSTISVHEAPHRFVDEQTAGPFRRWWHEHTFEETPVGTVMTDRVDFAAPLGPLGRLVERVWLTHYMTKLLKRRNAWLLAALSQ